MKFCVVEKIELRTPRNFPSFGGNVVFIPMVLPEMVSSGRKLEFSSLILPEMFLKRENIVYQKF